MKILIVDDNIHLLKFMQEVLTRDGHRIMTAHDGQSGLDLLENETFDLAFIDLNLPEVSGLELIKYVKEQQGNIKLVMMTGLPLMQERFARNIGADEYLTKPFKISDLRNIIRKLFP